VSLAPFVRRADPDRFLCSLFAPAPHREALWALIALNHELARAREAAREPMLALIRLQWWREAIEEAAAGKPPRRHEVAEPLAQAIAEGALDPADLLGLVDAREAEAAPIPTQAAFGAYLRGTGGGLALAAARLLGAPPAALPRVQEAGAWAGLAGVLRNLAAHAAQGRCLLPEDALAEAGLEPERVVREPGAAMGLVAAMAEEGAARLAAAVAALDLPRGAVAAVLPAVLARRDFTRLARGAPAPAARGLGDRLAVVRAGWRGRV
jgi:15-cis-phytoene synthase